MREISEEYLKLLRFFSVGYQKKQKGFMLFWEKKMDSAVSLFFFYYYLVSLVPE